MENSKWQVANGKWQKWKTGKLAYWQTGKLATGKMVSRDWQLA